jgi:SAM-dependent methyltransferase
MSTRADAHDAKGLSEYITGMANSKPDKAKILEFIHGKRILELGCGSGAVLELLQEHDQSTELVGIDLSAKLIGAATKKLGSQVRFHRQDIFELCQFPKKLQEPAFSSVILCSALHEFATFALEHPEIFFEPGVSPIHVAAKRIFSLAKNLLEPGGTLIVRDGVKLEPEQVTVKFKSPELEQTFWHFSDDFRPFKIEFVAKANTYTMQASHFYEFATKYFYQTNWDIEVSEIFGWASSHELEQLLCQTGFSPETRKVYTIDFLRQKWQNDFEVTDQQGNTFALPSTQIISARANQN